MYNNKSWKTCHNFDKLFVILFKSNVRRATKKRSTIILDRSLYRLSVFPYTLSRSIQTVVIYPVSVAESNLNYSRQ